MYFQTTITDVLSQRLRTNRWKIGQKVKFASFSACRDGDVETGNSSLGSLGPSVQMKKAKCPNILSDIDLESSLRALVKETDKTPKENKKYVINILKETFETRLSKMLHGPNELKTREYVTQVPCLDTDFYVSIY